MREPLCTQSKQRSSSSALHHLKPTPSSVSPLFSQLRALCVCAAMTSQHVCLFSETPHTAAVPSAPCRMKPEENVHFPVTANSEPIFSLTLRAPLFHIKAAGCSVQVGLFPTVWLLSVGLKRAARRPEAGASQLGSSRRIHFRLQSVSAARCVLVFNHGVISGISHLSSSLSRHNKLSDPFRQQEGRGLVYS